MLPILFNNTAGRDYYQAKALSLGTSQDNLDKDVLYKYQCMLLDKVTAECICEPILRISDISIQTGMVKSKKEFERQIKTGALTYNNRPIDRYAVIAVDKPWMWHELRLGKRFLEIATQG